MPPSGYLLVTGPASSALFVRGTLDKLGIRPNIHRIEDYKTAAEMFTETERSPASREMARWLLGDLSARFVEQIAAGRGRDERTVRGWIDRGLYSPRRAHETGLIDGVRYWDELKGYFDDADVRCVGWNEYLGGSGGIQHAGHGPRVAVIHAQGQIVMGESGFDVTSGPRMGSESIIRELRRARRDPAVKAVVLRVDSPGGDGIAGDMIAREVELTADEKPVVVSMSDVAASGGYEISYRADRIVALPGSVTGSIGSIMGKLNMRGLYNTIGMTKDEIATSEKSLIFSDYRDFSPEEWRVVREEHWEFYRNWIAEIARFRGMSYEAVDSLARGRVWTGAQAAERGLVDDVGGFGRAVAVACELADIDDPAEVTIVHLPTRLNLLRMLLSGGVLEDAAAGLLHRILFDELVRPDPLMLERRLPAGFDAGRID
jgi:protease-4